LTNEGRPHTPSLSLGIFSRDAGNHPPEDLVIQNHSI
jgi:hypothetical protein